MPNRNILIFQLAGTLLILAFIPGNLTKLFLFFVLWAFTFKNISKYEIVFFIIICIFFTIMNALSLKQGVFVFINPDILGMPFYELFMWGFYLLHTSRIINGRITEINNKLILVLAILFSAAFGVVSDPEILLFVTLILLGIGLFLYHEKLDFIFVLYMIGLGAAIEYVGVWSGEWYYPDNPLTGVPLWFITLWGGVGFFLHRLFLPILGRYQSIDRKL